MKPRVYTVTVCKDEDCWIGPTLQAWYDFAEKSLVCDTGSIDHTIALIDLVQSASVNVDLLSESGVERMRVLPGKHIEVFHRTLDVGASMVVRQELIERVPREDEVWVLILDADEVFHEDSIRALLDVMADPEIDYIGTRPVPVGWDGKTCFYTSPLEPFDPADRFDPRLTTAYWCPRVTIHAMRRTRLDSVSDPTWGRECFSVKLDPERHRISEDFKELPVPEGHIPVQFSGRVAWTDIAYAHMTGVTRSSKWREIPQEPGSNAMDRCRCKGPAPYPLPPTFKVPESVTRTLATLERPW